MVLCDKNKIAPAKLFELICKLQQKTKKQKNKTKKKQKKEQGKKKKSL
jgi:hypothetical protein